MWVLCKAKPDGSVKVREIWDCGGQSRLPTVSPHTEFKAHLKNPMANVFGILTAIVLALAAFVAFKNKDHYDADISATHVQKDLLVKSQARLKAAQAVLKALPIERAGVDAEVDKLTSAEAAQKKVNDDLKQVIDAKTAKISANKEKLDDIRVKTEKSGNISTLAAKLRATSAELEELAQSITGAEAKLANLTGQIASTDTQIGQTKSKFESFANGQSLPTLKTRIRSIYPNWGFVTLASGNNAGVVANSTLNVERDGQTIAKLLVTAVETSSASASIVPDSMVADVTLMVGDHVVPGQKAAKPTGN